MVVLKSPLIDYWGEIVCELLFDKENFHLRQEKNIANMLLNLQIKITDKN